MHRKYKFVIQIYPTISLITDRSTKSCSIPTEWVCSIKDVCFDCGLVHFESVPRQKDPQQYGEVIFFFFLTVGCLFVCVHAPARFINVQIEKKKKKIEDTQNYVYKYNIFERMTYEHVKNLFVWSLSHQVSCKMKQIIKIQKIFLNFMIIYLLAVFVCRAAAHSFSIYMVAISIVFLSLHVRCMFGK